VLSLRHCKELLPPEDRHTPDTELERLRDRLTALADLAIAIASDTRSEISQESHATAPNRPNMQFVERS